MELNNYFKEISKRDDRITKQAFSKQRCNLNPQVFLELNRNYVRYIYDANEYKTHKGYIITAIDGSYVEIPNTRELQEEYDCKYTGSKQNRTMARALASEVYYIQNKIMLNAIIDNRTASERTLALDNIEEMLFTLGEDKKIITIFDRSYAFIDMLVFLLDLPIKCLFRLPEKTFINKRKSMKSDDEIINIEIDYRRLYKIKDPIRKSRAKDIGSISVRLVKITLSTSETEYLLTNISDKEMSTTDVIELFCSRWGIELAYDVLKNKLHIENISGRKRLI